MVHCDWLLVRRTLPAHFLFFIGLVWWCLLSCRVPSFSDRIASAPVGRRLVGNSPRLTWCFSIGMLVRRPGSYTPIPAIWIGLTSFLFIGSWLLGRCVFRHCL